MRKIISKGNKIYLTQIDVKDAEKYLKWMQNPSVLKGLAQQQKNNSLKDEEEYLQRLIDNSVPAFTLARISDNEIIGNYGIFNIDKDNNSAEIGGFIGENVERGNGYGTEAVFLVADYAFKIYKVKTVRATVYGFNKASIKTLEKNGFKQVAFKRDVITYENNKFDEIIFSVDRDDFYQLNQEHNMS